MQIPKVQNALILAFPAPRATHPAAFAVSLGVEHLAAEAPLECRSRFRIGKTVEAHLLVLAAGPDGLHRCRHAIEPVLFQERRNQGEVAMDA